MSRLAKEILVIGFNDTTNRSMIKYHFDCDTVSDLPTLAEGIAQNVDIAMTSTAHVIETDEDYEMKSDGSWVKQKGEFELSLDAAAVDYDNTDSGMTADNVQDAIDEIDQEIDTINDTDNEQDRALAELYGENANQQLEINYSINIGAKNIINNTADASRTILGITWTKNDDGSMQASGTATGNSAVRVVGVQGSSTYASAVPIPPGTYTVSASGFELERYRFVLGLFDDENSTRATKNIYNEEYTFTVSNYTSRFDFSCLILNGYDAPAGTWYPMIRDSVVSSKTYKPYAPSNRELYEMILQLQSAAGLRSTTLSLRSAAASLENEVEEEVTEDEER